MNTRSLTVRAALLSSLLTASALTSTAQASLSSGSCGALAPQHVLLGDSYLSADQPAATRHTRQQNARIAQILSPLTDGDLRYGNGTRETCLGSGNSSRAVVAHFTLEQIEFRESLSGIRFVKAFEDRHTIINDRNDRRAAASVSAATLELPASEDWQVDDNDGVIRSSRLFRQASAAGRSNNDSQSTSGSTLVQVDLAARRLANHGLEISETTYINGVNSGRVTWRLER